ncbi:MAG: molybdopterin-dependent oxidoreductase [Arhodomonas sp.]|nr:molybdopterin-dependent oxidoreductase [Arhodomonas sp.]
MGPNSHTLPGYYGLSEGAWRHWCRVWDVDYEWLRGRFDTSQQYDAGGGNMAYTMNIEGIPVSRWVDGVLESPENLSQRSNFKAVFFQGHAVNSQSRGVDMKKAVEQLDLVVISDPYPTHLAVMSERSDGVYLLPTCTQFEQPGSVTASNRSLQWREKVVEPLFESKTDAEILYLFAEKFGFAEEMFKHIAVEDGMPSVEDTLREINRGTWTIGYTGQSPERLKLPHRAPGHLRYHHAASGGGTGGRGVLRPALALLGDGGDEAPRHPHPLRHQQAGGRGRPVLPRALRGGARGRDAAGGGLLSGGLRDRGRSPRIHLRDAAPARLGRGSHRRRDGCDPGGGRRLRGRQ